MTNIELIQFAHDNKKIVKSTRTNQHFNTISDNQSRLCICRVGGGFVTPMEAIKESEEFELVDELPTAYRKGVFHIEADQDFIFEGYTIPENRWNGWAIPVFEIDVAKRIMAVVNATMSEHYSVIRDNENGKFTVEEFDWESTQDFEDFVITVNGKEIVVVGFMGVNWTWEDCYGEDADQMLARYIPYDQENQELQNVQDTELPLVLYHGTSLNNLESINNDGVSAPSYWGDLSTAIEYAEQYGKDGVVISMLTADNTLSANVQLSEAIAEQDDEHKLLCDYEVLRSLEELDSVICHSAITKVSITDHYNS